MRLPRVLALVTLCFVPACLPVTEDDAVLDGGGQTPGTGGTPAADARVGGTGGTGGTALGPDAAVGGCVDDSTCLATQHCVSGRCVGADPGCRGPEDCASGQACVDGTCQADTIPCTSDAGCAVGMLCNAAVGICIAATACVADAQCPDAALCVLGYCTRPLDPCRTDRDCPVGTVCESSACAAEPVPCDTDRDCPDGTVCDNGTCAPEPPPPPPGCAVDADCGADQVCRNGACVAAPPPPECTVDADCGADRVCTHGTCEAAQPECVRDADCGAGQICTNGTCGAAPPPECVRDADCGAGRVCNNGNCEAAPPPPECVRDTDCGAGRVCNNGNCVAAAANCDADLDCPAAQICRAGTCQVPPAVPPQQQCNPRAAAPNCPAAALCVPTQSCDVNAANCAGVCAPSACDACTPSDHCGGRPSECVPGTPSAFCLSAGNAPLGADCNIDGAVHCQRGLTCILGTCHEPCGGADCGAGSIACPIGETCLDLSSENGGLPYSVCHHDCDTFNQRTCGAGEACTVGFYNSGSGHIVGVCDGRAPSGRGLQGQACTMDPTIYWGNCRADHLCTDALSGGAAECFGICSAEDTRNCTGASHCVVGVAVDPNLGFCIGECDVYGAAPRCGAGTTCQFAGVGITPQGADIFSGLCQPGVGNGLVDSACTPDATGASDCVVGSICATADAAVGDVCIQLCDPAHGCPAGKSCTTAVFASDRAQGASNTHGVCI